MKPRATPLNLSDLSTPQVLQLLIGAAQINSSATDAAFLLWWDQYKDKADDCYVPTALKRSNAAWAAWQQARNKGETTEFMKRCIKEIVRRTKHGTIRSV